LTLNKLVFKDFSLYDFMPMDTLLLPHFQNYGKNVHPLTKEYEKLNRLITLSEIDL